MKKKRRYIFFVSKLSVWFIRIMRKIKNKRNMINVTYIVIVLLLIGIDL